METTQQKRVVSIGRYELWFVAQLTMGLVYVGGAMFLLPPFTLSLQGATPGDVGIVMAILPLIALAAPMVGGLLEKYGSFRLFQLVGLGLFAVGFGVLSLADELIATDRTARIKDTVDHYLVCDASGDAAVIEFLDGKMVIHR